MLGMSSSVIFCYLCLLIHTICLRLGRGMDGWFKDDDLARILQEATESPAGAYGARTIHPCMRVMEMAVMKQAREWKVCSFNDFRKFLGLKRVFNHLALLFSY